MGGGPPCQGGSAAILLRSYIVIFRFPCCLALAFTGFGIVQFGRRRFHQPAEHDLRELERVRLLEYYLADNRLGQMFIADQWEYMDLSALAEAQRISFNVSGTLTGLFGLNTPGYFAVDDVRYTVGAAAVPEPSSPAMAGGTLFALLSFTAVRRSRFAA